MLTAESWDRLPALRRFVRTTLHFVEDTGSPLPTREQFVALGELLFEMIRENYAADLYPVHAIIAGDDGTFDDGPFAVLSAYLLELHPLFGAFGFADENGLDRGDVLGLNNHPLGGQWLAGWHDHKGCLFIN